MVGKTEKRKPKDGETREIKFKVYLEHYEHAAELNESLGLGFRSVEDMARCALRDYVHDLTRHRVLVPPDLYEKLKELGVKMSLSPSGVAQHLLSGAMEK